LATGIGFDKILSNQNTVKYMPTHLVFLILRSYMPD
jgi:hypothetical protein